MGIEDVLWHDSRERRMLMSPRELSVHPSSAWVLLPPGVSFYNQTPPSLADIANIKNESFLLILCLVLMKEHQ